ncbi:ABC transporter permease [Patescibacteria group bacterium]
MVIPHLLKTAYIGLKTNKTRSALTILGIVIGITAIILIVSIGKGAEGLILKEVGGIGADTVVIRPGKQPTGPTDFADTLFSDSITKRDVEALRKKSNVPGLKEVIPAVIVSDSVSYKGETYRPQIFGWSADFAGRMLDIHPEEGELFGDLEEKQKSSVAVIGSKVKEELFGQNQSPIGEYITIKGKRFRVVGTFPEEGQNLFFNVDEVVLVPVTTAQTYLLGIDHFHEVMMKAESPDVVDQVVHDIEATIREMHDITDPEKDDFFVETQQGMIEQIAVILGILTAFLSSVVAISLVVGGIGVMNIMLVSVTERTKEIGLRKAVGATDADILKQFLIESVVLTGIGGIIGITLGILFSIIASYGLSAYLNTAWDFNFPVSAALLGVGVSAFVGLLFGIYPARKASRKSPIEALRYE